MQWQTQQEEEEEVEVQLGTPASSLQLTIVLDVMETINHRCVLANVKQWQKRTAIVLLILSPTICISVPRTQQWRHRRKQWVIS